MPQRVEGFIGGGHSSGPEIVNSHTPSFRYLLWQLRTQRSIILSIPAPLIQLCWGAAHAGNFLPVELRQDSVDPLQRDIEALNFRMGRHQHRVLD